MEEDLVRMATELTRRANQMHEMQLELQRIATTTRQAEERAKVAEEKAIAAVTAIGMVKAPEQRKTKLNNRDAEKFWPELYTADPCGQEEVRGVLGRDCRFQVFILINSPHIQRFHFAELQFGKFSTSSPFMYWRIRFKTQVSSCSDFPRMLC